MSTVWKHFLRVWDFSDPAAAWVWLSPNVSVPPLCAFFYQYALSYLAKQNIEKKNKTNTQHTSKQAQLPPLALASTCVSIPRRIFTTVGAELKADDSFCCVLPPAPVVYNEIGVLQTTSAHFRDWMFSSHGVRVRRAAAFASLHRDHAAVFSSSRWLPTNIFPWRICLFPGRRSR